MQRLTLLLFPMILPLFLLSACLPPHEFAGTLLSAPHPAPDIALMSADGPVQLSDFRGKWTFLYFGYTFCPDACPLTLSKLTNVHQQLDDAADQMQVVMVSVDPERDSPEILDTYVHYFDESFVGITGSKADIDALGEPFGIYYEKGEGSAATGYLVIHSTRFYLIDPDGNARVAYPHETTDEQVLSDLQYLLRTES
ncbi:MAG: SCO family protein [Caldilineaceae bacterium]|nr:SCO family protein [Caldilineaceae bacterium]MCB0125436.1 SCO family protein [Caldilineaceae bacterium]